MEEERADEDIPKAGGEGRRRMCGMTRLSKQMWWRRKGRRERSHQSPLSEANYILIVDTVNGFNNLSWYVMLVQARICRANGSRLVMNCYLYLPFLCLWDLGQASILLQIQEGVRKGYVLAIMIYGIMTIYLINKVKEDVPNAVV